MTDMKSVIQDRQYYKATELEAKQKKDGDITVFEKAIFLQGEPNKFNPATNDWVFEIAGKEHVLNSAGHLNFQMNKVKQGDFVTAIYKGKQELTKGTMKGKSAHQWDIRFAHNPDFVPSVVKKEIEATLEEETGDVPF